MKKPSVMSARGRIGLFSTYPLRKIFEQQSANKSTFTRAKDSRWKITVPGWSREIRKHSTKRIGRAVSHYLRHPNLKPGQYSVERNALCCGVRRVKCKHPTLSQHQTCTCGPTALDQAHDPAPRLQAQPSTRQATVAPFSRLAPVDPGSGPDTAVPGTKPTL